LVDAPLRFTIITIAGKGSTEVRANLSTETRPNGDPQNLCKKQANEGQISNMTKVQKPYKLPLNPELTAFAEKAQESASNVIGYQHAFEPNM
jgi:adenylylsulfate kinase-like enzyme